MKKFLSVFIAIIFAFLTLAPASYALTTHDGYIKRENNPSVSKEEAKLMEGELRLRDLYADDFVIEPLYDADNEPSFLLGTTSLGSAIMDRRTAVICECGEFNPFVGFELCRKYYGGLLSYYVRRISSSKYTNIVTGQEEALPLARTLDVDSSEDRSDGMPTKDKTIRIPSPGYITRYAFGVNRNGTCNQVACGVALNYLKRKYGYPLTMPSTTPELLTHQPKNDYSEMMSRYPKAEALHQLLNIIFGPPLFEWGSTYADHVNTYIYRTMRGFSYCPSAYSVWKPSIDSIERELLYSRPVIIQTWNAPTYGNHAMVCYGTRSYIVGGYMRNELLVHNGWYNENYFTKMYMGSTEVWEHKNYWVNLSYITFGYFFALP